MINKYQASLRTSVKNTMDAWLKKDTVTESELYRFLHGLKGTAGSIGLPGMSDLAEDKLQGLHEESDRPWPEVEWRSYLQSIWAFATAVSETAITHEGEAGTVKAAEATQTAEVSPTAQTAQEAMPPLQRKTDEFLLIIDDDHDFVAYLKQILEEDGYTVNIALTAQQGLELYYQLMPDWVAIDIHLPDQNGFDVLTQIVHKARKENTPIAMMSSDDSKPNRLLAYRTGALDFISKPIETDVFLAYIRNRLDYRQHVIGAITVDELTGAYNRKHFNAMLSYLLARYQRENDPFVLVMMDIDHFKRINDTYGHPKGDEVLQTFVSVANGVKRETDMLFRYGGEEFAMLMPNTDEDTAVQVVQRMRTALAGSRFPSDQGEFQVAFSSGIVQVAPHRRLPEELIENADQALYHAKQNGRDQAVVFHEDGLMARQFQKLHMIIIDDVFVVRNLLAEQFENWRPSGMVSVNVSEYADGVSFLASKWYHPGECHVILLDGMLPNMDGLEVLGEVRKQYPNHNVIVTMLTARGGEVDVIRAIEQGADDYMVKPFEAEEVLERVQKLIGRKFGLN